MHPSAVGACSRSAAQRPPGDPDHGRRPVAQRSLAVALARGARAPRGRARRAGRRRRRGSARAAGASPGPRRSAARACSAASASAAVWRAGSAGGWSLPQTTRASSSRAIRTAARRSVLQIDAPRLRSPAFASATAATESSTAVTSITGPGTRSRARRAPAGTPVRIGEALRRDAPPPQCSVAPSASASSIAAAQRRRVARAAPSAWPRAAGRPARAPAPPSAELLDERAGVLPRDEDALDRAGEAAAAGARAPQRAVDGVAQVRVGEHDHRVGPARPGGQVDDARRSRTVAAEADEPLRDAGAGDARRRSAAAATAASAAGARIAPLPASSAVPRTARGSANGAPCAPVIPTTPTGAWPALARVSGCSARGSAKRCAPSSCWACAPSQRSDVDGGEQLERGDLRAGSLRLGRRARGRGRRTRRSPPARCAPCSARGRGRAAAPTAA